MSPTTGICIADTWPMRGGLLDWNEYGCKGGRSMATQTELGAVVSLWRYPVKSMMGEELNATEVTTRGLRGDRAYALVDGKDGKVATAKNPRKWPQLFDFRATFIDHARSGARAVPIRITLPDGTMVTSEQEDCSQMLSRALAREVMLDAVGRGDEVRLSVTSPCRRCVMTTLPQGDLPRDPDILRTAAQHNHVQVGVYAAVVRGGTIRRGDSVRRAA